MHALFHSCNAPNVHCSTIYNSQDINATKCLSTDQWIKRMWYIHTVEYYSLMKEWSNAICSIMDGLWSYHTKWSESEKDKHHISLYVESKLWHNWNYLQNRNKSTDTENKLMIANGERRWGRDKLRVWAWHKYTTRDIKWVNSKDKETYSIFCNNV